MQKHKNIKYFDGAYKWLILLTIALAFFMNCDRLDEKKDLAHNPSNVSTIDNIDYTATASDTTIVKDGIHLATGLVYAEGFEIVRASCTTCHSAKLVTQNRATRAGWEQMIDWMQATQGLWELGTLEPIILDYLATHYAPEDIGRRANLEPEEIAWYILELEE
ncbi:MAG: monoheme cytochrome C [Bacteroidota bacterium]